MIERQELSIEALIAGLRAMLDGRDGGPRFLSILNRKPCAYFSTFPAEVVHCRLDNGDELRLFCKYSGAQDPAEYSGEWYEHRGGVPYEAAVYRRVIQPLALSPCRFYGVQVDPQTGQHWLAVDYLEGWQRVDWHWEAGSLAEAARWMGHFHLVNESRLGDLGFLKRYTPDYYLGWVSRTTEYARLAPTQYRWLEPLCARFPEAMRLMMEGRHTVIHGEYAMLNILYRDGKVCPIDWESAAIAPGEIDIAALTDGTWGEEVVAACELAYRHARWPNGAPPNWMKTAAAARLYWQFRWIGQRPDWTADSKMERRFEALRRAGEQLELIE